MSDGAREWLELHDRKWYLEDRIDGRVEDVLGVFVQLPQSPARSRGPGPSAPVGDRRAAGPQSRRLKLVARHNLGVRRRAAGDLLGGEAAANLDMVLDYPVEDDQGTTPTPGES